MADTTGYNLFGGGIEDYVRQTGSDLLLVNTPLTVTNVGDGSTITDLLDGSGNPISGVVSDANGEYSFYARPTSVKITAPGGHSYTIVARSAVLAGANAGVLAQTALTAAQQAETDVQALAQVVGTGGGGGGTGTVRSVAGVDPDTSGDVPLTPAKLGARDASVPIAAGTDVTGLAPVALSGSYSDLTNLPVAGRVSQNSDGTWPDRPATSGVVTWYGIAGSTTPPAPSGTIAGGPGMVPNFDIWVEYP